MFSSHEGHLPDEGGDPEQRMRSMFRPMGADQAIRQAISTCWMMLPQDKKSVETVESEIRRLVDRALNNLREDAQSFGIGQ